MVRHRRHGERAPVRLARGARHLSLFIDVAYRDHTGRARSARVSFYTLLTTINESAPLSARYDPRDPDRIALGWAVDLTGARSGHVAYSAAWGLFGLAFLLAGFVQLRSLTDARRIAKSFEEVDLHLIKTVELERRSGPTGEIRYQYQVPRSDGRAKNRSVTFSRKKHHEPIFVRGKLLALRTSSAPNRPVVLRNDFYPFDLSETDRATALASLKHHHAASSRSGEV